MLSSINNIDLSRELSDVKGEKKKEITRTTVFISNNSTSDLRKLENAKLSLYIGAAAARNKITNEIRMYIDTIPISPGVEFLLACIFEIDRNEILPDAPIVSIWWRYRIH